MMFTRVAWLLLGAFALAGCMPEGAPSTVDRGAQLFNANCVACHQKDARGIPGVYPSLVGSPVILGDPKPLVLWVVRGVRPPDMPVDRYSTAMLQFNWMRPADGAALLTYVRAHFGNAGAPIEEAVVKQALDE